MNQSEGEPISEEEMNEKQMWELLPHKVGEEKAELLLALSKQASYRGAGEESLTLAESAQEIYESLGALASNSDIANAYTGISYSLKQLNKTEEALKVMSKVVEIYKSDHLPFVDDLLRTQATWYSELGQWEKTLECHKQAARVNEIDDNHEWLAKSQFNVGVAYGHLSNFDEALRHYQISRNIFKSLKMVPEIARCDEAIAEAYVELGNGELALAAGIRALDIARILGWQRRVIWTQFHIGKAQVLLGNSDAAEAAFEEAIYFVTQQEEFDWHFIVGLLTEKAKLLRLSDRTTEAEKIEARIATIRETLG
jgi:tetratricopeptide (TPR) repeat protein